jgi:dolichol-phosphate mannosyltransferase
MILSIVIPMFNEQESLPATLTRVLHVAEPLCPNLEVLLVDDGSRDGTWDCIASASDNDKRLRGIRLSRNFGHQVCPLRRSAFLSRGIGFLSTDADLQDPPELLVDMMSASDAGADVAYGRRLSREGESAGKVIYRIWLLSAY